MHRFAALIAVLLLALPALGAGEPATVDLLAPLGLKVNAAGPLLVRLDPARDRLVVANTLSSSVTLIDCRLGSVRNIAVSSRVPQYLKAEALAIDSRSGNVYVIGDHALEVVLPDKGEARSFRTAKQFEMVAVDEASGRAFLVGRESREMAVIDPRSGRTTLLPWTEKEESAVNLNQTPPPPLRKVVCDSAARTLLAVDGSSAFLRVFDADTLRPLGGRALALEPGGRWHYAGYSPGRRAMVLVVETAGRKVIQAAKVAAAPGNDVIVDLPGFTEAVGVRYSEERDELYIPYDNHPSLHVVDFKEKGPATGGAPAPARISEVMLPAYGNDASALDEARGLLYVASWAYGEVDQVDLATRRLRRRFRQVPVLPHMFHMEFNPGDGRLYLPLGATAVNGAFGAAVTVFDPASGAVDKIRTGWAPQEMLRQPGGDAFLVFDNEDQMARVQADGRFTTTTLPVLYPHQALATPAGNVCLAYGPHQSYWPVVYIWAAHDGILGIDGRDLSFYDRRVPRLAQAMALSPAGTLFALQNNWGDEKQFYVRLDDEVRAPNQGDMRVELEDVVSRETSQRLIAHDAERDWLLIARAAEKDGERGILQVVDARAGKTLRRLEVGITPAALAVDESAIYVANFDGGSLSVIAKDDFSAREVRCGRQPLKIAMAGGVPFVINHGDNTLFELGAVPRARRIPFPGRPDQLVCCRGRLWITSHSAGELIVGTYDPATKKFALRLRYRYPYGQAGFAGDNSSFFMRGQFGDCLYGLCQVRAGAGESVWVSDFLAGKVFIFAAGK